MKGKKEYKKWVYGRGDEGKKYRYKMKKEEKNINEKKREKIEEWQHEEYMRKYDR